MHEDASLLGRLALEAIPSSKAFYLDNRQVSAALHHHTLYPSSDNTCQCGEAINFGLAETLEPATTERHETHYRCTLQPQLRLPCCRVRSRVS
jgi:hypothetical protein